MQKPCEGGMRGGFDTELMAMKWVMTVPFGLLFVVANFIAFPLHERITGAKHLQLMTGLSPVVYWLSAFFWDYLIFLLTSFLLVIPIFFLDKIHMVSDVYEIGKFVCNVCNLFWLSCQVFH